MRMQCSLRRVLLTVLFTIHNMYNKLIIVLLKENEVGIYLSQMFLFLFLTNHLIQ